jgi:hypothetical protein
MLDRLNGIHYLLLGGTLFFLQGIVLFFMGQPAICTCDTIRFFEEVVLSSGNSQHLTDWYTISHVLHGVGFYYLLTWFFPRLSLPQKFFLAIGLEVGWEILENSDLMINRYRETALAQGYAGDSIINSLADTLAMLIGFAAARRFSPWLIIPLALSLEAWSLYMIHDGLFLNIVQIIHPFDFIEKWQQGG